MGLEIVLALELRHGAPVPLGHVRHPAAGVVPLLDGDGVVKPFPEDTVIGLPLIRRRHLEVLQRADDRLAGGVKQGFLVGTVVEEESFVLLPGAEVASQQGEYPVFRLDLPAQDAAQFGEADEALQ